MNDKSKTLLAMLFAAMLTSMTLFGVSCKREEESTPSGTTTDVVYYCETDGEDYTVSLTKDGRYVLSMVGDYKYGEYTLSEGGELKLVVDGQEVTATVKGDELSIVYGGKTYTLLEKIKRTVTFNDGDKKSSVTVLNGAAVERPEDPEEKEGKTFVGWYTTSEYTATYNFATPVRSDISVYAQYVEISAGTREFCATLKDGSDAKKTTVNGALYGLEDLGEKEGKEFDGWYVSAFNDEKKLTYKYSNETLKEDVNLYPVWKNGINGVKVSESKITWEGSGSAYEVKITDANNVSDTKTVSQTYLDYDFAGKTAGEYKIEITDKHASNTFTAYYNNKALARVSNISVIEGGVVTYNAVDNAEKYYITIECGNENHRHENVDNGKRTYYDISGCDMKKGGIKITVTAKASGYASSESAVYRYEKNLEKVNAVEVKDGKLVWNAVENALGYVVVVNGEEITLGNVTEYSLKTYAAGDYTLGVYPVTKGYNSPDAKTIEYTKEKLSTPAGVAVNGNVVKWETVEGATGYVVEFNGNKYTTETETVTLKDADVKTVNSLTVTAIGDNGLESEPSDAVEFSYDQITELEYFEGKLTWKGTYIAEKYVVTLNGTTLDTLDGNVTEYDVNFKLAGKNTLAVGYTVKGSSAVLGEVSVDVTVYTVSFSGEDGEELGSVLVAVGDYISAPEVTKAGYVFAGWYKVPDGVENNAKKFTGGKLETAGDVRFYADFDFARYTVILNADAGKEDQIEATVGYQSEFYLAPITSEDSTKTFGGWYTDVNGQGKQVTDYLGNGLGKWNRAENGVKLYAKWLNLFTFTYKENGFIVTGAEGLQYVTSATIPETCSVGSQVGRVITLDGLEYGDNLVSVSIPDTIVTIQTGKGAGIGSSAFQLCKNLQSITIYETGNAVTPKYSSSDGILYEAAYTQNANGDDVLSAYNLLLVPYAKSGEIEVIDDTTSIASYAFSSTKVEKVILPKTVVSVGDYALANMAVLTEIEFLGDDPNKEVTVGERAFSGNSKLIKVTLPSGLKASTALIIENGLDREEQDATDYSEEARRFTMEFDVMLFTKSFNIQEVNVQGNGGYYKSFDGMLCKADGTIVYCPRGRTKAVVTSNDITAIGVNAFRNCSNIKSVTIGGSVKSIGLDAFVCDTGHPSGLTELIFDTDINDEPLTIGERAFYKAVSLTEVTLPENLVSIGKHAFGFAEKIKTVTINAMGTYNMVTQKYEIDGFASDVFIKDNESEESKMYFVETVNVGQYVPAFGISATFGSLVNNVNIDENNENFYEDTETNIIYSADGKMVVYSFVGRLSGELRIKDGVEVVCGNAFSGASKLTSLYVPATVKTIGDGAFRNCGFSKVEFETEKDGSATSLTLGYQAFKKCSLSGTVTLPARLTEIGEETFESVSATEIKFTGTKLKTVGKRAFANSSIKTVTLSDGVETIGDEAFYMCKNLVDINLPNTIQELGSNLLWQCYKLQTVNVADGSSAYTTRDGVLYKNDENGLASVLVLCPTLNSGNDGVVTIPDTVIEVKVNAFSYNKGIKKVIFEDYSDGFIAAGNTLNVEGGSLISSAFSDSEIEYIKLPRGMVVIESYSFIQAKALKEVVIPNTVKKINSYAFTYSSALEKVTFEEGNDGEHLEIADGTSNTDSAFGSCTALKEIVFPARTTKIGAYAFSLNYADKNLTKVVIPANVTEIGAYAFQYRSGLTDLTIEDSVENPSKLATIKDSAFRYTKALASVVLPTRLGVIEQFAFADSGITSLNIPGTVEEIGKNAFENCASLTSLTFGATSYDLRASSVMNVVIGEKAFNKCTSLKTLELPEGLISIGDNAFTDTAIAALSVPFTVTSIGKQAFMNAPIKTLTFVLNGEDKSELKKIGDEAFSATDIAKIELPETTGSLELGAKLFKACMNLTSVKYSSSVASIGSSLDGATEITDVEIVGNSTALQGNLLTNGEDTIYTVLGGLELTDGVLEIPEGITTIADSAFVGHTEIKKLVLPSTLSDVGVAAFKNCTGIEEVEFRGGGLGLSEISESMFENCLSLKTIEIPSNIVCINYRAFAGSGLETIKIPASVEEFGYYTTNSSGKNTYYGEVFRDCVSLKKVEFAKKSKLTYLTDKTFYGCSILGSVSLPDSLTDIGGSAFYNSGITSVNIGVAVTSIGASAFFGTSNLKSVVFADNCSLATINSSAFKSSGIVSIEIPFTVTTIGGSAFASCTSLTSVTFKGERISAIEASTFADTAIQGIVLPDSITVIKGYAFQNCASLTSVKLPSRLTTLATIATGKTTADVGYVFDGCTSLESIDLPDSLTYIGTYTFKNTAIKSITIPENVKFLAAKNALPSNMTGSTGKYFQYGVSGTSTSTIGTLTEKYLSAQFAYCGELEEVILPANLQAIGSGVFYNTPKLKKVTYKGYTGEGNVLPVSVTELGGFAFADSGLETLSASGLKTAYVNCFNNSNLKTVNLTGSSVATLAQNSFKDTSVLTNVTLSAATTKIDVSAFENSAIQQIGNIDNVTSIGDNAFAGSAITSINLPKVTSFGTGVFSGCKNLVSVMLSDSLTSLSASMFKNCSALSVFNIGNKVTSIGDECLLGTAVESLVLPASLSKIGTGALSSANLKTVSVSPDNVSFKAEDGYVKSSDGKKLVYYYGADAEITIPDNVTIQVGVFAGNKTIKKIIVPDTITTITTNMFYNCLGVEEIVLSEGVKTIQKNAFSGCESLNKLVIPSSVTSLVSNSFNGAGSADSDLTIDLSAVDASKLQVQKMFENSYVSHVILPEDMTEFPQYFLRQAIYLKDIKLPEGVTTLTKQMFYECSSLEEIDIPASVTSFEDNTFNGCTRLKRVNFLGNDLTSLPNSAFNGCYALEEINLPEGLQTIGGSAFSGKKWKSDGVNYTDVAYGAAFKTITIPSTVTKIDASAFQYCRNLETVIFKGNDLSVTLGTSSFSDCDSLANIDLMKIKSFGATSFQNTSLENITISGSSSVTYNKNVFKGDTKLKTVTFTDGKAKLGDSMFAGCTVLEKVILPSETAAISASLFSGLTNLKTVVVPDTVTSIGASAFSGCTSLESVNVGNKVTTIGNYAFQNCTSIKSIYIPDSVTSIGSSGIFSGWTAEQTINFGFEGYKAFKLYGDKLISGSSAKVNFGVTE